VVGTKVDACILFAGFVVGSKVVAPFEAGRPKKKIKQHNRRPKISNNCIFL
jgi:hypothetical protein